MPLAVDREVRQGEPLSALLLLEILSIRIRNGKDICGITIDNEESETKHLSS